MASHCIMTMAQIFVEVMYVYPINAQVVFFLRNSRGSHHFSYFITIVAERIEFQECIESSYGSDFEL